MSNLTAADVDEDVTMLIDSFSVQQRSIPTPGMLMSRSVAIPVFSLIFSLISTAIFYMSTDKDTASVSGFFDFFMSEGWYLVAATIVVGVLFSLMAYSNLLTYMAVPEEARKKSLIIRHLKNVTRKTVIFFCSLIIVSCILSGLSPWFTIAIPALTLTLFIVVNAVIGMEINRLGIGLVMDKLSALVKKI